MKASPEPASCGSRNGPEALRLALLIATPIGLLAVGLLTRLLSEPALLLLMGPLLIGYALVADPPDPALWTTGVAGMVGVAIAAPGGVAITGLSALLVGVWALLLHALVARGRTERDALAKVRNLIAEIPGSLEPTKVLDAVVQTAAQSLGAKAASIRLVTEDQERLEIRAVHGLSENYLAKGDVVLAESELDRMVLRGEAVCLHDVTSDARFQYPEQAQQEGITSILCVPLCVRGQCGGVLRVYSGSAREFRAVEVKLLTTFGAVAAIALEQAHAHQGAVRYMRKAAHELRSPLCTVQTIVRGAAQGLTGEVDEQTQDLLSRAANRVDGLLAVLDDLLSLSRMRMAPPSECDPVDFREAIESAVELHEPQATEKSIRLDTELPDFPCSVRATPQHLEDLARNLISNAVKYTPEGGSVTIVLCAEDSWARLRVADTGIGIPEADLAELGTEFRRAQNARKSGVPGTGLGLSIVKSLLDRYGGRMDVESVVDEGSTFTVEIPFAK